MDIYISNKQNSLSVSNQSIENLVRQVLELEEINCQEISVNLVDTQTISQLHLEYFGDSTVTDCISFPIDSPSEGPISVLGEVCVCPETAVQYGKKHQVDPYYELTLYLVHGILHLIGYDDHDESEPVMRKAEKQHMKFLQEKGLLLKQE